MKRSIFFVIAVISMIGMLAISGCEKNPVTYTVSFDSNGGTGTMTEQKFTEGESKALTANKFTRDGYVFKEWNTDANGIGETYTDGQQITVSADMVLYAQWENPNKLNGRVYVDLGLPSGLLWADSNVNTRLPESYGLYIAWAETVPNEDYNYTFPYYKYSIGGESYTDPQLSKYCNNAALGFDGYSDNLTTIEASDDAATAQWGEGWRIPTKEEMQELIDNCTITWTTRRGFNGKLFTGPNGNSIFLTANGSFVGDDDTAGEGLYGRYWTSSLNTDAPGRAWSLNFTEDNCSVENNQDRCNGLAIRPVCRLQN